MSIDQLPLTQREYSPKELLTQNLLNAEGHSLFASGRRVSEISSREIRPVAEELLKQGIRIKGVDYSFPPDQEYPDRDWGDVEN